LEEVSVLIGGEAGAGVKRSGLILAKAFLYGGLHVFGTGEYESRIRGGHNLYQVRAAVHEVYAQNDKVDVIIALNEETIIRHASKLRKGGAIIYDGEKISPDIGEKPEDVKLIDIPLRKLVEEVGGEAIMQNSVALGALMAILGWGLDLLEKALRKLIKRQIDVNVEASRLGYEYAKDKYGTLYLLKQTTETRTRVLLSGNEAVGIGAALSGCKFYAAYPMTPASPLLHFLARHQLDFDMVVIQAENEIAAANMVIGASYAGVRAMTATSGGGFCLMTESLGLAAMTETPIVIMLGMRPGPSTGLPTRTAQGDLYFALHASQGEFPRVVVAPGDVEECLTRTTEAFHLAEKYQIPAIILADKYVLESIKSVDTANITYTPIERHILWEHTGEGEYARYKITETGVSPRAVPSAKNAIVKANSNEHDEYGYTTEDRQTAIAMMEKRFRKLGALSKEIENLSPVRVYGEEDSELTIVGWGSTKGPILEALKLLRRREVDAKFVQFCYLSPFPYKNARNALESSEITICVENNYTGQFAALLREKLGLKVDYKVLRYDGRPFTPKEILQNVEEVLLRVQRP